MESDLQKKRNSCKAVIINNKQVLCVKKEDEAGPYYVIPGGGQNWGEELHDALIRECIEEIGTKPIEIFELICIREFIGARQDFPNANKNLHQVEFYWHCSVARENVKTGNNPDAKQIGVEWLDIKNLEHIRLYPHAIKEKIINVNNKTRIGNIYVGAAD